MAPLPNQQIESFRNEVDLRFDNVDAKINRLEISMAKKVNWTWYFGTLLTELALIGGIMGAMFAKIEAISHNTYDTREAVSRLEGKLEPFDFVKE